MRDERGSVQKLMALLVLGALPFAAAPAMAEPMTDEATLDAVVEYVDEQRQRIGIPGMAVAIVGGGRVLELAVLGEASAGEPVREDTPFLINSIAKSVTALSVVQLVDAGSVDMDAPITDYLPELSPGADDVTVADLMHHVSGLRQYDETRTMREEYDTLEKTVLRLEPLFGEDRSYAYTNGNYDTLALLVERVSGMPFQNYVAERVFAPVGMERSIVAKNPDLPGAAQGHYHWLALGYRPHDEVRPGMELGSAHMWASIEDMAAYTLAHLEGSLVSAAGLEIVRTPDSIYDSGAGYAGGLVYESPGIEGTFEAFSETSTNFHDGGSGTFRSMFWFSPEADLGMVLLANGNDRTDEGWIYSLSYHAKGILAGEEPADVQPTSDFTNRWSKWLLLALGATQLALVFAVIPALQRKRAGEPLGAGGWVVVGAATLVDLAALWFVLFGPRTFADSTLRSMMQNPDHRILVSILIAGVAWGVVRTAILLLSRPSHGAQEQAAP